MLREPTLIAQSIATLDELTGGRAEAVLSCGNFGLLAQYGIDWTTTKPLSRVKEAHHVVRTLLDDGAITFDGEFFNYSGLFTFARPVQEHVPVHDRCDARPEVVRGGRRAVRRLPPRAQLHAGGLRLRRRAHPHRRGAGRQGRRRARHRAWVVFATGADSAKAKDAARAMVGIYASSMPAEQLERNGVDPPSSSRSSTPSAAGDLAKGIELTSPELADRLSVSGSPAECAAKIRDEIAPSGVNHMILAITDRSLVKAFTGHGHRGRGRRRHAAPLIHDEVIPAV